ncbi:hypothetical protein BEWA_031190 [Theileria equi strain WA]|uniref:Poly(A) RNA polymerase mitochondrial-like central palm domain-containing protein n=1 Tax=Theileria equi strain WA TaxID=1537102 RepID=L0AZ22_THEEQ|nr:hypothetical protein BEWA_031190 [Theileria equi strain WA]AFZ80266.1 hypothetical protein BEWA_031190 [Theileria equi strain WA]|eukprot:XP_004829932.1 hypothetical protein BEWA_031190 [Theileria equi strain WA]
MSGIKEASSRLSERSEYCTCACNLVSDHLYTDRLGPDLLTRKKKGPVTCNSHYSTASDENVIDKLRMSEESSAENDECDLTDVSSPKLGQSSSIESAFVDGLDSLHCSFCNKPIFMYNGLDYGMFDGWINAVLDADHPVDAQNADCGTAQSCTDIVEITSSILMSSEDAMFTIVSNVSPGEDCTNEKNQLFDSVKRFLQYCLGDDTIVHLTGSTAYDIDIDYSDIASAPSYSDLDIVVLSKSYGGDPRTILQKVYSELSNMQYVLKERNKCPIWVLADSNIKLVESAKVPIVIIETKKGLFCDISVNTLYPLLHTELFKNYIDEHPMVRPLMRIIKHWLILRGVPSMKEGGFPSIFWMSLFCNAIDIFDSEGELEFEMPKQSIMVSAKNCEITSLWTLLRDRHGVKGYTKSEWCQGGQDSPAFSILSSLEKCFQNLSSEISIVDIVNRFNYTKSGNIPPDYPKMSMFCKNLMRLIQMEPNLPYGTWLVYYYELTRARGYISLYAKRMEMLITLLAIVKCDAEVEDETPLADLPSFTRLAILIKESFGYDIAHLAQDGLGAKASFDAYIAKACRALGLRPLGGACIDRVKMLLYHMFQQFKTIPMEIFEKVYDNIYSIPADVEPPVPLYYDDFCDIDKGFSDTASISLQSSDGRTFDGTLWDDSGWYIVVLQGKLTIVKVIKVCIEWESWWSRDFVSRRDNRSVFHGFVYRQLKLDYDVKKNCASVDRSYPSILIKRGSLVLFNPCDIVSKLHVLKVIRHEQYISPSLYSTDFYTGIKCLYILPGFEVDRFQSFEEIASRLKTQVNADFRSQTLFCKLCGIIIMKRVNDFTDFKITQRKLRNAKHTLCNQKYMSIYKHMELFYKNVKQQQIIYETDSPNTFSQAC